MIATAERFNFAMYHWLGIPPEEQPPNLYRLLSLPLFFDNPVMINAMADNAMVFIKTKTLGPHAAEAENLLNLLSGARIVLTTPHLKAEYDRKLRLDLMPDPQAPPICPQNQAEIDHFPLEIRVFRRKTRRKRESKAWALTKIVLGGIAGLIVGYAILNLLKSPEFDQLWRELLRTFN